MNNLKISTKIQNKIKFYMNNIKKYNNNLTRKNRKTRNNLKL